MARCASECYLVRMLFPCVGQAGPAWWQLWNLWHMCSLQRICPSQMDRQLIAAASCWSDYGSAAEPQQRRGPNSFRNRLRPIRLGASSCTGG